MTETQTTKRLCEWINKTSFEDIPEEIRTRSKYLILDGICCVVVGAHLPWTEKAVRAVVAMESPGNSTIWGYERKLGPLPAALLNATSVQSFEIDDWHYLAPLHSNAIVLPALLAAASHLKGTENASFSGKEFLTSTIIGYETGPRTGLALYGIDMLRRGWHSGTVFGHVASSAAVSRLLNLSAEATEDAIGIACTQACGLMSAQNGSEAKRMQHGFAARNGLFGALMARGEYTGIKDVLETPYGGYLAMFGEGSKQDPLYKPEEVTDGLGEKWQLDGIRVKPHASMAGTHCGIDCVAVLQEKYPEKMAALDQIVSVKVEMMGEAMYHHGGFEISRPIAATGAQMSSSYAVAVQLIHGRVSPMEFAERMLNDDERWKTVEKVRCCYTPGDGDKDKLKQRVTVAFKDGSEVSQALDAAKTVTSPMTNEEILAKWRVFTDGLIDDERRQKIEKLVLGLEDLEDVTVLEDVLAGPTRRPI